MSPLRKDRGQYDDEGEYCGLSTASEMFHIFTTLLYSGNMQS